MPRIYPSSCRPCVLEILHIYPTPGYTGKMDVSYQNHWKWRKTEVNSDVTHEDEQPFPTLKRCLDQIDLNVGFNIEIKYPLEFETGESEMENYFDLNPYIDQILNVVLKNAGDRKIIFSTFHPDTCLMVQLKQNKYPVLLLSNGPTKRYTPYKDWRCTSFEHGINFAKAEGLLGVNFQAEGLIQDLTLIPKVQNMGLVLFVWGEDLNDENVKDVLRKEGVDGIIFDRIEHQHEQYAVESSTDFQQVLTFAQQSAAVAGGSIHASSAEISQKEASSTSESTSFKEALAQTS
nr:hypothetical protein BaRGS_005693 [Batillaria attramentaria]